MAKRNYPKYNDGDIVIVDRSGAGENYYFGKVIDSTPHKNGCNNSFLYTVEGLEHPVDEYYVRLAEEKDLELKKLHSKLKIDKFEIDDDRIKRVFWRGQKGILNKATNFINSFLYPYLKLKGHIIEVDKMTDWDASYKTGMHTKNDYVFIIPHDSFNIVVQKNSTYVSLFITLPNPYYKDKIDNRSILCVICMATEYSDDEYTDNFVKTTKEIIKQLEKGLEEGYYNLWIRTEFRDKLALYKEVLPPKENYLRTQEPLPGYEYTSFLMDLSCLRYYFFSSNFTLRN
jgi:hypothetical protein